MATLVVVTRPLAQGIEPGSVTGWRTVPVAAFVFPLIGLFMAPIYPAIVSVVLSALPRPQHAAMTGLIVVARSEEHTSELQSLMLISYAVFCLKKKTHRLTYNIRS